MPRNESTLGEIVSKWRQLTLLSAQGGIIADAIRAIATTDVTYDRWRKEYGSMKTDQVSKLKGREAVARPHDVIRSLG